MHMIKIIHLCDDLGLGGVNRSVDSLMARLDMRFAHSRVHVLPTRELPPALDAQVVVVHFTVSWHKLAWLYGLRARNPNAHFILVEHSYTRAFEALNVVNRKRFRRMLSLSCGLMDRIIAVSKAQGDWLIEAAAIPAERLVVINPAAELDALRALPLPLRRPGPLRLCGYGRYCRQKGFDTLIDAMRLVPPNVATLRLVGLGPDERELRRQAAALPHVRIEGPVAGPAMLFGNVDAVAIPSRFEAFGLVAAEARAAGCPIIVSGIDGLIDQALPMPELTVPPQHPAALAQAIIWLADRDIAALGAIARQSVQFTEQHTIGAWNLLLHTLGGVEQLLDAA
jgi:glycosyltransferase involved in cell wall biosynthesis